MTAYEYGGEIIVVDCGMAFPGDDMYGIDCVIPDVTYLIKNRSRLRGLFITHGHEDHIGAIPYVLKQVNMPIYCTRFTAGLIKLKLQEHRLLDSTARPSSGSSSAASSASSSLPSPATFTASSRSLTLPPPAGGRWPLPAAAWRTMKVSTELGV